jgi:hypothetical protein
VGDKRHERRETRDNGFLSEILCCGIFSYPLESLEGSIKINARFYMKICEVLVEKIVSLYR